MARVPEAKLTFSKKLRKDQTDAERKIWAALRSRQLAGFKFRRQKAIGPYVVDFCCLSSKIVIELDGGQHQEAMEYDARRTKYLEEQGFEVIRFWDNEALTKTTAVTESIYRALTLRPLPRSAGEGN